MFCVSFSQIFDDLKTRLDYFEDLTPNCTKLDSQRVIFKSIFKGIVATLLSGYYTN